MAVSIASVTKTSKINTCVIRKQGCICVATCRGLSDLTQGAYVTIATITSSDFYPIISIPHLVVDPVGKKAAIRINADGKIEAYSYPGTGTDCQCYANIAYIAKE